MGFPTWTLWGMGAMVFLALLLVGLAYLAQSPRLLLRLGLSGYRLDLQVRTLTGYAFACLLLLVGFFLAGVPLGGEATIATSATPIATTAAATAVAFEPAPVEEGVPEEETAVVPTATEQTLSDNTSPTATEEPSTGAFVPEPTATSTPELTPTATSTQTPTASPTDEPEETAEPTATATLEPTETATSRPTQTATPIVGDTVVVNTGSSTVWARRTPGGQNLVILQGGEVVILLPGHANRASTIWQEIRTVDGVVGWLEEDYLDSEQ